MAVPDEQVGAVQSVWRYPVRSMRGEALERAAVGARGVAGDRCYALVDPERFELAAAASAPRRWAQLLGAEASLVAEPRADSAPPAVRIRFDDGAECTSDDPQLAKWLSDRLGRSVALWREPDADGAMPGPPANPDAASLPRRSYDPEPLHLVTSAAIRRAEAACPGARFDPMRFRPNALIDTGSAEGFVENAWLGRTLAIGPDLRVEITELCERCVMTTLPQAHLERDRRILETLTRENDIHFGVYGRVLAPGTLSCGDRVQLV